MSIDPIDPISALIPVNMLNTFTVTPLKNGEAVEHAVQSTIINGDGRTISVSQSVLTVYDRFANLQTIPPQSKGELV
jgi:hypothetical protein